MNVTMYTTSWCPYCVKAKALLSRKGVTPAEINIEEVAGAKDEMIAKSGLMTVPQIFVGDRHLGGCDDLYALEQAGQLDAILQS